MDERERIPNWRLTNARERLRSPAGTGQPMSQRELAEAVNAWLWRHTRQIFAMSGNLVGKYELGTTHWPHRPYRDALCAVLGVQTPAELGFYPSRRSPKRPEPAAQAGIVDQQPVPAAAIVPAGDAMEDEERDDRDNPRWPTVSFPVTIGVRRSFTDLAVWLMHPMVRGPGEVGPVQRRNFVTGMLGIGALTRPG